MTGAVTRGIKEKYQKSFESAIPENFDKTKNEQGDYTNTSTQAFWLGYCLRVEDEGSEVAFGFRQKKKVDAKKPNWRKVDQKMTNFVVARFDDRQTGLGSRPVFSKKPHIHSSYARAEAEATLLSNQFENNRFGIYGCVQIMPSKLSQQLPSIKRMKPYFRTSMIELDLNR